MSLDDRENLLRKIVRASCRATGSYLLDIPDEIKKFIHLLPPEVVNQIEQKPFDQVVFHNGRAWPLELKVVKDSFSFIPRNIMRMPHQWDSLRESAAAGLSSGLLLWFNMGLTRKQRARFSIDSWVMDLTFFFPTAIIDVDKSYSVENLLEIATLVPKLNEKTLDLSVLWRND